MVVHAEPALLASILSPAEEPSSTLEAFGSERSASTELPALSRASAATAAASSPLAAGEPGENPWGGEGALAAPHHHYQQQQQPYEPQQQGPAPLAPLDPELPIGFLVLPSALGLGGAAAPSAPRADVHRASPAGLAAPLAAERAEGASSGSTPAAAVAAVTVPQGAGPAGPALPAVVPDELHPAVQYEREYRRRRSEHYEGFARSTSLVGACIGIGMPVL